MKRNMLRLCAVAITVSIALVGLTATSASASGTASFESETSTLFSGCREPGFSYDFFDETGFATDWVLEGILYDPRGDQSDSVFESGSGPTASGVSSVNICDYEPAGTYFLSLTLTWSDADFQIIGSDEASAEIEMRKPSTRTALWVSDLTPRYNSVVRFRIRSSIQHPNGFFANQYEYVILQYRAAGAWYRVRGSKTLTDDSGVARLRYRFNVLRPIRIRAVTLATSYNSSSVSRPRTVDAHR